MIEPEAARLQAKALRDAERVSPVRQLHYEFRRRAVEWERASDVLEKAEDGEAVVELAGAVVPGMRVLIHTNGEDDWAPVIRQMEQRGQFTIHVQDGDGRDRYLNYFGPSSPVVVRA